MCNRTRVAVSQQEHAGATGTTAKHSIKGPCLVTSTCVLACYAADCSYSSTTQPASRLPSLVAFFACLGLGLGLWFVRAQPPCVLCLLPVF